MTAQMRLRDVLDPAPVSKTSESDVAQLVSLRHGLQTEAGEGGARATER
jgi:hypothetical protein